MNKLANKGFYAILAIFLIVNTGLTCQSEAEDDFDRLSEKIKSKEPRDNDGDDDGGAGGGGSCDAAGYDGPEFDIQVDSQCKAAYYYDCTGNSQGVAAACAVYKQWQDDNPDIPDCPYCS